MPISPDTTYYQTFGDIDKPVVVLIHGLGLSHQCWQWHTSILAQHFYIVSYDLYGHGNSRLPSEELSLSIFSNQLYKLLNHLSIKKCHLVGFSLGGMINRRFAVDHPDYVETLEILNSPHERTPEAQKIAEQRVRQNAEQGPAATIDEVIERWFTIEYRRAQPEVITQIRTWVLSNDTKSYQKSRKVLVEGVLELLVPTISAHPALVMTAENDSGSTPQMADAISHQFKHAKTIIIPQLKHMGMVENPQAFTTPIIDFILTTQNISSK